MNDFAASLGLPKDIRGAAATAIDGKPYLCDVGQFGDRHFIGGAVLTVFVLAILVVMWMISFKII